MNRTQEQINIQNEEKTQLRNEVYRLSGLFEKIKNGELCIYADYYPCAVVSGLSPDHYLEYKDPDGVGRIYEESAFLICRCFYMDMPQEAVQLYGLMKKTEIFVYTDVYAYLDLEGMVTEKLAEINLKKLKACEFYAIYSLAEDSRKAQAVYDFLISNANEWNQAFHREGLLLTYLEMPELTECVFMAQKAAGIQEPVELSEYLHLPEFWDAWIVFLKKKYEKDHSASLITDLLTEALQYRKKTGELLEMAELGYIDDVSLYWEALCTEELRGDYAGQVTLGRKAMNKFHSQKSAYSDFALWTARAALCMKEFAMAEHYCAKAVTCNAGITVYLLAFMLSGRPERIKEIATEGLRENQKKWKDDNRGIRPAVLQFFLGNYDAVPDFYEKKELYRQDLECVTALLILSLVKDSEWKEGCRYMADVLAGGISFSFSAYVMAITQEEGEPGRRALFQKCFLKWKDRQHTKIDEQKIMPVLERMIDGIIRKLCMEYEVRYEAAAGFAAAYGELKESMGEKAGKQCVLMYYREEFVKSLKDNVRKSRGFSHEKAFDIYLKQFGMME